MKLVGLSCSESNGRQITTLYCQCDFDSYYDNPTAGRFCEGQKTESIYAGTYDCSGLEIGQDIEVYYGKAISTAKGTFQPIALIRSLSE